MINKVLLIPHIKIHNANALSSPITIGFPAMTAWLGAMHALQRKLNDYTSYAKVRLQGVGVVCHHMALQTHKGSGDFVYSIIGTANPTNKDGKRPAFIEEARCHLDVSLLVDFSGIDKTHGGEDAFIDQVDHLMQAKMKIAGGDIISSAPAEVYRDLPTLKKKLMPGYALIERKDLMLQCMEEGSDAMTALLNYLAVHHTCKKDAHSQVVWESSRKTPGWIVPIATGFQGVSAIAPALNQRDPDIPHCFAESIITLGEFKMPYRLLSFNEFLWRYQFEQENSLYLCQQDTSLSFQEDIESEY